MKKIIIAASILSTLICGTAYGQLIGSNNQSLRGDDLMRFSNQNFGLSTARSAAMGGAFTSLGADMSSMSINPAGLGMYRSSEVVITPGMGFTNTKSSYMGGSSAINTDNSRSRFSLNNFGAVMNFYEDQGTNFVIGLGYNKLADFNGEAKVAGFGQDRSMADVFAAQLKGIPAKDLGSPTGDIYQAFWNYRDRTDLFGAIMAYQSNLVEPMNQDGTIYAPYGLVSGDLMTPNLIRRTNGEIGEYVISGAANIENKFYVGLTVGLQDLYYTEWNSYQENDMADNQGSLIGFDYNQDFWQRGTGVNFKLGMIYRPTPDLRIGVSYHSPTWMYIRETYGADMTVEDYDLNPAGYSDTPYLENEYNMRSPSRLLAGISYNILGRAIVSLDYERAWYGSMRYSTSNGSNNNSTNDYINQNIKANFRSVNNIRAGVEVVPVDNFFLRAGYAYYGSPYKDTNAVKFKDTYTSQYSGGVGYRNSWLIADLAYVHSSQKTPEYQFFNYEGIASLGTVAEKINKDLILLTLGFKF